MAGMFSSPVPVQPYMPPPPPPDDSAERAEQREQARKKEVTAQKAMGRGSTLRAGRSIALAKQQEKAAGLGGASNALGLLTS